MFVYGGSTPRQTEGWLQASANEQRPIPTLVLPIERGVVTGSLNQQQREVALDIPLERGVVTGRARQYFPYIRSSGLPQ